MSSGSQFPSSPQPNMISNTPFHSTLIHDIKRSNGSKASPTCITPLSGNGEAFVVSYSDAAIIIYDTRTGEEIGTMASLETYDGTIGTSVNSIVATTVGLDHNSSSGLNDEDGSATGGAGPTGGSGTSGTGIEGVIISGHEDRFIRFFDANSGRLPLLVETVRGRAADSEQANAPTICSPTPRRYRPCRSRPTVASWCLRVTMRA